MREGPPGLDGLSAYEIACARGFRGSPDQWLATLRGERGDDGKSVDPGEVRELVAQAVADIPRPADGAPGEKGDPGAPGPRGEPGSAGKDAPAPVRKPWHAVFERSADLVTRRVVVAADDGSQTWALVPKYRRVDSVDLVERVSILPV